MVISFIIGLFLILTSSYNPTVNTKISLTQVVSLKNDFINYYYNKFPAVHLPNYVEDINVAKVNVSSIVLVLNKFNPNNMQISLDGNSQSFTGTG